MTRHDDTADQRAKAPQEQAEQQGEPGLEPPHQPNANQVRDEPIPASHQDEHGQEGLNPAEAEASDE